MKHYVNGVHFAATLLNLTAAADNLAKPWRSIVYHPYLAEIAASHPRPWRHDALYRRTITLSLAFYR